MRKLTTVGKKISSVYQNDPQKQIAFENALDCFFFGLGRHNWSSNGLEGDEADKVWKRAFRFVAEEM